jgi:hypothetical protein
VFGILCQVLAVRLVRVVPGHHVRGVRYVSSAIAVSCLGLFVGAIGLLTMLNIPPPMIG